MFVRPVGQRFLGGQRIPDAAQRLQEPGALGAEGAGRTNMLATIVWPVTSSASWPTAQSIGGAEPTATQARIKGWIATIRAYCFIAAKGGCDHLLIMDGDQNHTAFAIGLVALPLLRCGVSTIVFGSLTGLTNSSGHTGQSFKQKAGLSVVRRFFRLKKFRGIITTNPALARRQPKSAGRFREKDPLCEGNRTSMENAVAHG